MAVYLDSSALVKLVVAESESSALLAYLAAHPERVCSALCRVEVVRAVQAHGPLAVARAARVLSHVRVLRIDDDVLEDAAVLGPALLRSFDAIHHASARTLGSELARVVTYDRTMVRAAQGLGLAVAAPGAVAP